MMLNSSSNIQVVFADGGQVIVLLCNMIRILYPEFFFVQHPDTTNKDNGNKNK